MSWLENQDYQQAKLWFIH